MRLSFRHNRSSLRIAAKRSATPSVESLEGRQLLYATLGGHFVYGSAITYSFVPDGTSIGGVPSNMNAVFAARGYTQAQWQTAVEKAAAIWETAANINLVQVSDNGEPYGAAGDQQGDPNVGDIRIGGIPLAGSGLAEAFLPPPSNSGTIAGDIVFNTNAAWQINNDYDLETVALHEFGHALGLDHSAIASAVMYANYTGMKQSLTTDDIQGIQAVWGPQPANGTNTSYTTATNLTGNLNSEHQASLAGFRILAANDTDWYYVVAPTTSSFTITMQATNLSSLSPKLMIYDGALRPLVSVGAPYNYGATIGTTVQATAGQGFYIRASTANAGPGCAGSYGLQLNFGGPALPPIPKPYTTVGAYSSSNSLAALETVPGGATVAVAPSDAFTTRVQHAVSHPRFAMRHRWNHAPRTLGSRFVHQGAARASRWQPIG